MSYNGIKDLEVPDANMPNLNADLQALVGLPLTGVEVSNVAFGVRFTFNDCVQVTFTSEGVHTSFDATKIDKLPAYFTKYLAQAFGGVQ